MGNNPLMNDELLPGGVAMQSDEILGLMSAGWTNERHSTYISSMEASLVDQLYGFDKHKIDAKRSHLGGNGFKVIRNTLCMNSRFEGADASNRDFVGSTPGNLLIRRFRPHNGGVNRRIDGAKDLVYDYGSGTDTTVREKVRIHGREVKGFTEENIIEVSDQNFSEEEHNVEASDEPYKKRKPTQQDR